MKTCQKCKQEKFNDDFTGNQNWCKVCIKEYNINYRKNNKHKYKKYKQTAVYKYQSKDYKDKNKEHLQQRGKEYYQENKEKFQQYYEENRETIIRKSVIREKQRRMIDPAYKIRRNISAYLRATLKQKGGKSITKYLPYEIEKLKTHLEQQFEPWMTWNNWGRYDPKTWDDNNPATWAWQIDHIIPHSIFKYSSMEEEDFKKCWALENLRPLSAKQNFTDGVLRVRH